MWENESSGGLLLNRSTNSNKSRQENGDQLSLYRRSFVGITRLRDDVMYSAEFMRVCKQAERKREIVQKDEQGWNKEWE